MAAKKANEEVKLSDELTKIVDDLVSSSKSNGSISEDDIQVAIRDVDVNMMSFLICTIRCALKV